MAYTSVWESLSVAAGRLVRASGSQEQARWDICRALADGAIGVRAKLAKHAVRLTRSTVVVCGNQVVIPTDLTPDDFDWEHSRPVKSWFVRDRHYHHGPWDLEVIELSKADVTAKLLSRVGPTAGPMVGPSKKHRGRPQREGAEIAIKALWPDGVPLPRELPNDQLVGRVIKWTKENRRPISGHDTILRAAGRRK